MGSANLGDAAIEISGQADLNTVETVVEGIERVELQGPLG